MDTEGKRAPEQDRRKTKAQLLDELAALRRQLAQHSPAVMTARSPDPALSLGENDALRLLMENVQDYAILFLDSHGCVTQWNSGAERLLGYSKAEMLGQTGARIFTPEDIERGAPEQELQQTRATGRAADERWHQRKDGTRFWGSGILTALRNQQGQLRGFAKILRDLTERHNAAVEREALLEQLELERRRLETVLQQMPAGVVIAEAPAGKLVFANQLIEQLFGHPCVLVESIPQYTLYQGLHKEGRPYLPDEWPLARALTRGEEVREEEIRISRPDGTQVTALVSAAPIRDRNGHIIAAVTVANDVTPRKQAEEATQRRSEELQQFAYIVSHDLSEPLRTLQSFVHLLAEQTTGRLDAAAGKYMTFIADATQRLQQMLTALLAYTRAGQTPEFTAVDCEVLLAQACNELHLRITESGAVITHDPLPTVRGDATHLGQVFQNLISNALKFCRPDAPPRVHISVALEAQHWRFAVRDNGIGIDPAKAGRLFQVFQRLHSQSTYAGTGIGLAICKRIIEQHGGRIWVESRPGQGATFFFTIGETSLQTHES